MKPRSKQVVVTELEASVISEALKEKMIAMIRSSNYDLYDLEPIVRTQKRYEDILEYIRRKEYED